jgi:hypothetical protein
VGRITEAVGSSPNVKALVSAAGQKPIIGNVFRASVTNALW